METSVTVSVFDSHTTRALSNASVKNYPAAENKCPVFRVPSGLLCDVGKPMHLLYCIIMSTSSGVLLLLKSMQKPAVQTQNFCVLCFPDLIFLALLLIVRFRIHMIAFKGDLSFFS